MRAPNPTLLSHWFPLIHAAGLPVPRTVIVRMPKEAWEPIFAGINGEEGPGDPKPFFAEIDAAALQVGGYPCFLRTGLTSGKHNWKETCFLPNATAILRHVGEIALYSELADMIGLDWTEWAVREFLPTKPWGVCRAYGDMPIVREFRFFVDGGSIECWHPYWPLHALEGGAPEFSRPFDYDAFCRLDDEAAHALARKAGEAVGGRWSVDILETARGWFVTDMAEAEKSFHWAGCAINADRRQ